MAYETCVDNGASETFLHPADDTSISRRSGLGTLVNVAGGVVSLALIAGIGLWGYKLMVRDVSGIPVVRAADGDMRIRPEDPGGESARHQGLAVNAVAAEGGAQSAPDTVTLAPQPVILTDEDVPLDEDAVAIVQQAIADQQEEIEVEIDTSRISDAAEDGDVEGLVAALTEGVTPLESADAAVGPEVVVQVAATQAPGITNAVASALSDVPGVKTSLRPQLRPDRLRVENVVPVAANVASTAAEVDASTLPAGTRLVQLGAYDSIDVAQAEWAKFVARFGDVMSDKSRVVEQATSGGRKFFRLRAMGFEDLADARRFCSALVAEGADCIPVVTR
jgi:hypothetical protein